MVSLDDAVLARMEKGGKRYEVLLDPDLVETWKQDHSLVELSNLLAVEDVFHDAKDGERPTAEALESTFGDADLEKMVEIILEKGSIQLTTNQRKALIEEKMQQIIHEIHSTAIDPKSKTPHPRTRIELALEESRFKADPFKRIDDQVKDAIAVLKPMIPLSFEPIRMAFRIPSSGYSAVGRIMRPHLDKEEWLSNGDWACIIEIPPGQKDTIVSKVLGAASGSEFKEL